MNLFQNLVIILGMVANHICTESLFHANLPRISKSDWCLMPLLQVCCHCQNLGILAFYLPWIFLPTLVKTPIIYAVNVKMSFTERDYLRQRDTCNTLVYSILP